MLAYIRADGTDEMRQASWWPVDPPHCEPQLSVDVRLADPRDPNSWASVCLNGLAMVLTDRMNVLNVRTKNKRQLRKASEQIADVLREVNGRVTWR